jgi:hypothetical protein
MLYGILTRTNDLGLLIELFIIILFNTPTN